MAPDRHPTGRDCLLRLLDAARWAPSGDNRHPWRFETVGHDTRDEVV